MAKGIERVSRLQAADEASYELAVIALQCRFRHPSVARLHDIRLVRKLFVLVSEPSRIRRALISCSDKLGLVDFASGLAAAGVQIYSTGGTRRHLESHGVEAIEVSELTNFPEMMDGRVKTLHPKIFGGILGRRDNVTDLRSMQEENIPTIDLVVVNLYPFEATINRPNVSRDDAIEQIDIGGPSLIRAAAKNHQWVTVATRPEQYSSILADIEELGTTSIALRRRLAAEAFAMTAAYDQVIADYFRSETAVGEFPPHITVRLERKSQLRYGENPHQKAAVYRIPRNRAASVLNARHIHGRELSYNNLLDLDSALAIARSFGQPAATVIKHNNPCGAATCAKLSLATRKALDGDPVSAFGSVLGFNRTVDLETAEILVEPNRFIEAIVAPDFEAGAVGVLTTRPKWRDNVRLMQVGRLPNVEPELAIRFCPEVHWSKKPIRCRLWLRSGKPSPTCLWPMRCGMIFTLHGKWCGTSRATPSYWLETRRSLA